MNVSVFIPSHITGFFSIKNDENPLKKGSCGAGVLINKGVTTKIGPSIDKSDIIYNNDKKDPKNEKIILKTMQIMKEHFDLKIKEELSITHDIEVSIGSGFGTSASCALGTAIGISEYFDLGIPREQIGQIAHISEILLGSGLGDVLSQTSKGVVIREFPGAPGIGKTKTITQLDSLIMTNKNNENNKNKKKEIKNLVVLTKTFGEIDTSSIIQNQKHEANINKIGSIMQKKIMDSPTIENFMDYSYQFAIETNLISKDVLAIIKSLNEFSIKGSMAMLGNTVFAITTKEKLNDIKNYCKNNENNKNNNINISDFEVSKIDNEGIRIF